VTTTPPSKQPPRPGERWAVSDALPAVVAAGPVTVLDMRGDRVIFADSRGAVGSFAVGIFAGLFDPPPP
jgi:hypothetical protein